MERTGTSLPSHSVSYGHACSNCVRTKCKCVMKQGTTNCERCHRLNKQCVPGEQVRKRVEKKPSKRTQLEDRLNSLVTLLEAQQSAKEPGIPSSDQSTDKSTLHPTWHALPSNAPASSTGKIGNQSVECPIVTPATSTRTQSNASPAPSVSILALDESLDECLHTFRTAQLKFFPCIFIPASMTVTDIQIKYPFLWLNIQAICTRSTTRQNELALQTREIFSRQVLVEGECSLDLLLGAIVQMAWKYVFFRPGKPFLSILSSIAKAMVSDTRLLGPIGDGPVGGIFSCPEPSVQGQTTPSSSSHEQRRALLGCFLQSSSVSSLCRYFPMPWDTNIEEAANSLQSYPECPNDECLVAIVRISRIIDDTAKVTRLCVDEAGPLMIHVKPLQQSLESLKSVISPTVMSNKTVHSYWLNCKMTIYELALFRTPIANQGKVYDFRRVEYLHSCLQASIACIEHFISFSIEEFMSMTFFLTLHCLQGLRTLYRLSIFDEAGWDRAAVRQTSDVIAYLDQLVKVAETVHRHVSEKISPESQIWSASAERLRSVIPIWKAGLDKADGIADGRIEPVPDITLDPLIMDFLDDSWYMDVFCQ